MRSKPKARESHRRSKRLPLEVPVHVYGRTPDNTPFRDLTRTLFVSAHGGLLVLNAKLKRGQTIRVVHDLSQEERDCRVVYLGQKHGGKRKVGFEFAVQGGDFWHIYSALARPR